MNTRLKGVQITLLLIVFYGALFGFFLVIATVKTLKL